MAVGDIKISSLKLGNIDLTNPRQASQLGFNIYEDILNPYGPLFDVAVVDYADALGASKLNGDYKQDIDVRFSLADGGETIGFKFKFYQNKNLNDQIKGNEGQGALKHKEFEIRGAPPEYLNAQGNFVQKSYNDLTCNMVKDIVKNNFKSDKSFEIGETTKGKRRLVFSNEHPLKSITKLSGQHVASQSESSLYVLFQQSQNGTQKYIFTTFEKLFQQSPVVTLTQTTNLNFSTATENDKQNAILWINVSDSFFTPSRAMSKSSAQCVNLTTHCVTSAKPEQTNFKVADGLTSIRGVYTGQTSNHNEYPVPSVIDKANDKEPHLTADAKKKRAEFLSHLMQNAGELEVPGNPKIKLGSIVNLVVPKKAETGNAAGETQFNGKALVVAIKHKIKTLGETPRYTMILRVVKASYKDGGTTA
jgi:hypothetical protein